MVLVIFLSVFTVRENEEETVYPEVVFRKWQIAAAEQEWRDSIQELERATSARSSQSKRHRRASVVNRHGRIVYSLTDQSFLGLVY